MLSTDRTSNINTKFYRYYGNYSMITRHSQQIHRTICKKSLHNKWHKPIHVKDNFEAKQFKLFKPIQTFLHYSK